MVTITATTQEQRSCDRCDIPLLHGHSGLCDECGGIALSVYLGQLVSARLRTLFQHRGGVVAQAISDERIVIENHSAGEAVIVVNETKQHSYWSACSNDPLTVLSIRCGSASTWLVVLPAPEQELQIALTTIPPGQIVVVQQPRALSDIAKTLGDKLAALLPQDYPQAGSVYANARVILTHWDIDPRLASCFLDHRDGFAILALLANAGMKDWPGRVGNTEFSAFKAECVQRACLAAGKEHSWWSEESGLIIYFLETGLQLDHTPLQLAFHFLFNEALPELPRTWPTAAGRQWRQQVAQPRARDIAHAYLVRRGILVSLLMEDTNVLSQN